MCKSPRKCIKQMFKNQHQFYQKCIQNPTQNRPKNLLKSAPNRSPNRLGIQTQIFTVFSSLLDASWRPPGASQAGPGRVLGASWPPRWAPRGVQKHQKIDSKSRWFLKTPWRLFFQFFYWFSFHFSKENRAKIDEKSKAKSNWCLKGAKAESMYFSNGF